MKLAVQQRTAKGKELVKLRKEDILPGIIYAKHMDHPITVQCRRQDFVRTYKEGGKSTVIELKGDGIDHDVLIHDLQINPVTHEVTHVDFIGVKAGEEIHAEVTLILQGKAPVITSTEIRIQQIKDSVEIKAKPKDLPHDIKVDISVMENEDDIIYVKDLIVPKGVTILDDGELAVARVAVAKGGVTDEEEATETEAETNTEATE
ncbi:MAG: 50S ribosomal protein L25 [Candidatus Peribacteria bacterium]|nr:MAG: 50S ribosomal protein L25 [Candidatus Peribacteria bacterium]